MEQENSEITKARLIKPRNGFVAFILSLIFPGLGQVYNGELKKAGLFFALLLLNPFLFGVFRGATFFYGLLSSLIIEIALRIYIIIDGVKNAKRQKEYILKPYNTWYFHLLIAMGMLAILVVYNVRTVVGIRTFNIPTTSNNPTFQVGDRLVADLRAYRINEPDYGDIIIYSRSDGKIYTFRVVGLPNDNIELIDNIVTINGKPNKATFVKETINNGNPVYEFEEEFPNGHKHLIYKFIYPHKGNKANINEITVPPGCYYVLGDNRDNAADSRYEGCISRDRIKGRMLYSYWGRTTKRINIDFTDK